MTSTVFDNFYIIVMPLSTGNELYFTNNHPIWSKNIDDAYKYKSENYAKSTIKEWLFTNVKVKNISEYR